jgi:hypothetical protein
MKVLRILFLIGHYDKGGGSYNALELLTQEVRPEFNAYEKIVMF